MIGAQSKHSENVTQEQKCIFGVSSATLMNLNSVMKKLSSHQKNLCKSHICIQKVIAVAKGNTDAYVLCGFKTCLLCGARQYQNWYFSWRVSYFCLLSSLSPSLPVFSAEVQEVDESLQAELLTRLTLGKAFKWAILGAPSALSGLFTPDGFLSLLVQITYQLPLSTSSFCMHPSICVLNQLSSY